MYKERGAQGSPAVSLRHPVASTWALFQNRWWTIGIIVAVLAWVFHVAALALAPISLVQATIAGGLVLLTPLADRLFGHDVGEREWIGVGMVAIGLLMLVFTLSGTAEDAHDEFTESTLWLYVGGATVLAVLACAAVVAGPRWAGLGLGISCGLMWGASDVTIKAATSLLDDKGVLILLTPEAVIIAVLSLVGFIIGARSLQLGPAVAVIAATTAAANVLTIASGSIVFGEPLPDNGLALAGRMLGFGLVISGAVLTPSPQVDGEPESG
ncbi:MAG TPA: hypothetical protein PKB03_01305 [Baekduia sp.]|nr:hypothetical protein [Baekduia sp.]